MKNALMFGAAAVLVAAGCGYHAPYMGSGPSLSNQGVEIRVAGVRCYVNRGADPLTDATDEDQAGLELKLQVNNTSDQIAEVAEGQIRLAETDMPAAQPAMPRQSKVISVLPGETKQVRLAFMPQGVPDCRHSFALELADSVEMAGSQLDLSPITFEGKN
jgi:hypothetical protein